jgi:hypothetical protein
MGSSRGGEHSVFFNISHSFRVCMSSQCDMEAVEVESIRSSSISHIPSGFVCLHNVIWKQSRWRAFDLLQYLAFLQGLYVFTM